MNLALNPFDAGKKPESIDEILLDERVKETVEHFRSLDFSKIQTIIAAKRKLRKLTLPVLEPILIDIVYQSIKSEEFDTTYVSSLINTSYKHGNNDFILTAYGGDHLGALLSGTKKNRLRLKVDGDVGFGFGMRSRFCDFTVEGDGAELFGSDAYCCNFKAGNLLYQCGNKSKKCTFHVGNVGEMCGRDAEYSAFIIRGDCDEQLGHYASSCRFLVQGDTSGQCGAMADNSTFELHGKVVLKFGFMIDGNTFMLNKRVYDQLSDVQKKTLSARVIK